MSEYKFIDLFAGVGSFRMAFESVGAKCVFSSEIDPCAQQTYEENHGERPHGDITKIGAADIPDHDILCAGFPCQAFSQAGQRLGFDETRGTLFFDVARIIRYHRPRAFVLENVKNLVHHDGGRTFRVIYRTLTEDLGYHIHYTVLNAVKLVPQKRERIFIVGFREPLDFEWPEIEDRNPKLRDVLDPVVPDKYTVPDGTWAWMQRHRARHEAKGNGFGYRMGDPDGVANTIISSYMHDGSECVISQGEGKNPRRLTPREVARLMGFPETFKLPDSDKEGWKQMGNSIVMPLAAEVAKAVVKTLDEERMRPENPFFDGAYL